MAARLTTWEQIGGRVGLARQRAGFTQQALAERLGLHRSAVARVELGQRHLDALELARLAGTLGRTVEWFLTEPPVAIASHRRDLSDETDVQVLEDELERTARDVELVADIGALTLPRADDHHGVVDLPGAEAGAARARAALGRPDGPVVDLQRTVEELGMLAFSLDLGPSVVDGGYVRVGSIGIALVNSAAHAGRRRFNLAHELGHHLLADEYTADFGIGGAPREDREALINAFAIHFLMPPASTRRRWTELSSDHTDARSRLIVLAVEHRVSWSAAVSHAVTLELVPRSDHEALLSRRPTSGDYLDLGLRVEEELHGGDLAPAYAQAVTRAYRKSLLSAGRAVEMLRQSISKEELPAPFELPPEALVRDLEPLS